LEEPGDSEAVIVAVYDGVSAEELDSEGEALRLLVGVTPAVCDMDDDRLDVSVFDSERERDGVVVTVVVIVPLTVSVAELVVECDPLALTVVVALLVVVAV
jgi:hypothetical protein